MTTADDWFGPRGRAFCRNTITRFDLSPAELVILIEACRSMDTQDDLAAIIAADGP